MDDYLVCSDLCEEKGFQRQAELLRAVAEGTGKVYVVAERGAEYNDEHYYFAEDNAGEPHAGQPRTVFFRREDAEREADRRNAASYRVINVLSFGLSLAEVTDRSESDLNCEIGAILGTDFRIFPEGDVSSLGDWDGPNPFPEDATDAQMIRIVRLFNVRFFHVLEVDFAV